MAENKVTFELTDEQKKKHDEAGVQVDALTYDALEDRIAPSMFTGTKRTFERIPGKVGDL
jgi:hypothetical protein